MLLKPLYKKPFFLFLFFILVSVGSEISAQSITFSNTSTGPFGTIQTWTVPACVSSITIETWGAQGGGGSAGAGGLGAYMKGTFSVTSGQVLKILVGQQGTQCAIEGGGGGGTFVTDNLNNPLIIAGGGGGSSQNSVGTGGDIGTCGLNGNAGGALGGCAGNGGNAGADASSGGGLLTDGGNSGGYPCTSTNGGGKSFINGGAGGDGNCCGPPAPDGGFGGGGGTHGSTIGGGGGGGYSGGGGGANGNDGGGGGGSYNAGTSQSNSSGVQAGHGQVIITISGGTNISVSTVQTNVSCSGGNNGSATVTPFGGTSPYTYLWSSGGTGPTESNLSAGTYTITVTDASGCTGIQTVTITQPILLSASAINTNVNCNGGSNATATVTASGGTGSYTYSWSNGQTTTTATGLSAGTHTVNVNDSNGCVVNQTVVITQPPVLSSLISPTTISCNGGNNGSATAIPSGGTSPYTYLWSNSQTSQNATGMTAGNYSVTVTDTNGCVTTQTVAITQPAMLTASATVTAAVCFGGTGSAVAIVSGGTSPYSYLWSNVQTTQTATGMSAGNYTVSITDNNGCTQTASVTITQPIALTVSVTGTNPNCNGGVGSAIATGSGGASPYSYLWNNTQSAQTATGIIAGSYSVIITDNNGCTQTATVSISQPSAISISTGSTPSSCTNPTGTAQANASGGTPGYSYNWNNGQTTSSATVLGSGSYTVLITDANGCTVSAPVAVATVNGPAAAVTATAVSITLGNNTQLTASGGGTYSWWPATGLNCITCSNPTASPGITTDYCVLVTDGNGCTDSACVTINVEILCGELFIPNAFSPNNDGQNDFLCVRGNCIGTMNLIIYNRWGEKVFETSDQKICWDGIYKGKLENTAVFVYYIAAILSNGEKKIKNGSISLIR